MVPVHIAAKFKVQVLLHVLYIQVTVCAIWNDAWKRPLCFVMWLHAPCPIFVYVLTLERLQCAVENVSLTHDWQLAVQGIAPKS